MEAVTAYNEIVYLIKEGATNKMQCEYEQWLDSGGLFSECNRLAKNRLKKLSSDDKYTVLTWLLKFVEDCKISRKLNKNFKEIV